MTENSEERKKRVLENFEKHLPQIWEKARQNEERLKTEYQQNLLAKLLEEIRTKISRPSFDAWFSKLSIEELDDNSITLGTNLTIVMEWLETRYKSLIEKSLENITNSNSNFKVSFILREYSGNKNVESFVVKECTACGCQDFSQKLIEVPVNVGGILSMNVDGLVCTNCGLEYYDDSLKRVVRLFQQRQHEQQLIELTEDEEG
ncbi:DnaA N-terminal domain-containing protein [Paenibacillus sp. R14(2021)]|uniref:DnaA N-terminal domain-containing protein n=1 Tax=Paenibacillus sp. R14(2021) TaxID=2859228 RepID=UPI001C613304|nr:DnaA N-terminal domain-containing protein [Paenibacillus sp. R14(2021)]